jgi:murein DD-endopeptidase MepM/ murein hydrolase activator NlpD
MPLMRSRLGETPSRHRPGAAGLALVALLVVLATAVVARAAPADVERARAKVAELDRELAAVDAQAGAAAVAHNRALDRRDALLARVRATRGDIASTTRTLADAREVLAERLVAEYRNGPPDPIEALLRSGSIRDAYALSDVLSRAARDDAAAVGNVRERRARLEGFRRRLEAARTEAGRSLERAAAEQARIEELLAVRTRAVAAAREEIGTALAEERARQRRLAAERRAKAEAAREAQGQVEAQTNANAPSPSASPGATAPSAAPSGSTVFPVAGAARFSDDFLAPRPGGRYHEGIDIFSPRGTPIVAVADGTLSQVGSSGISGNRLWLRAGDGTSYFYAHLDGFSPAAREGASVSAGTVVGYNGDTGDARGTSPHLHFEIHPGGGGPVRPFPIISGWPRVG